MRISFPSESSQPFFHIGIVDATPSEGSGFLT